jgi:hypothetical protein
LFVPDICMSLSVYNQQINETNKKYVVKQIMVKQ